MPNSLAFTSTINGKNLNAASIVRMRFDEDAGEALVEVQLTGPSSTTWPTVYPLGIRNGSCDAVVPQTTLVFSTDIVKMERLSGGAGIATLFTDVLAAEAATSGTVAGQTMTSNRRSNVLKILQAAVGNRAAGSSPATATVLPAGTVS